MIHENFDVIEMFAEITIPQQLYYKEILLRNLDLFLDLEKH